MTQTLRAAAAAVAATMLCAAGAAAQSIGPQTSGFASVSIGGQLQTRSFGGVTTFTDFNAPGTITSAQAVGRGVVWDVTGGRRVTDHIGVAVGVWGARTQGDAAITAAIPDPIFVGLTNQASTTITDLTQTTLGINLQVVWLTSLSDRAAVAFFLGPSFVHVSQDVGTLSVPANSQTATAVVSTQSANSLKAGSAGADLSYWLNDRYGIGVFARYAGGEVDLPSAPKLKVGGVQAGGGLRIRF